MLAFGMMVEIGITLLTIGIPGPVPGVYPLIGVFFASLLPRGLALGVWALALIVISRSDPRAESYAHSLELNHLRGCGLKMPIASSALILAQLSIAGFPLLAGFPVRLPVWQGLADYSILLTFGAVLGSVGLLIASLRTLVVFVAESEERQWVSEERWSQRILLLVGVIGLFVIGIFPQIILPQLADMASVFVNLSP
jgi:NADH:ubiquinone oxidoreductase subunit 2 (subunit N)